MTRSRSTDGNRETTAERTDVPRTFGQVAELWQRHHARRVSPRRSWIEKAQITRLQKHPLGGVPVRELCAMDMDEFLCHLIEHEKFSPVTANDYLTTLRSINKWAIDNEIMDTHEAKKIQRFREPERKIKVISQSELAKLLSYAEFCDHESGLACSIYALAGMRRSTVERLEWRHVQFSRSMWDIEHNVMKARRDYTAPIDPRLMEYLKRHRTRPRDKICGLFRIKQWDKMVNAVGLKGLRPHTLRRTFITLCRQRGVPLEVTMYLADHRDIKTVLKYYRNIDPEEARKWLMH